MWKASLMGHVMQVLGVLLSPLSPLFLYTLQHAGDVDMWIDG